MLCQSLLCSKVTQLFIHIYTFFFYILFHYGLSQDIQYSSLCYTLRPCCLSILNIMVCIYQPQTPNPSLPHTPPLGNHKSVQASLYLNHIQEASKISNPAFGQSSCICCVKCTNHADSQTESVAAAPRSTNRVTLTYKQGLQSVQGMLRAHGKQ